MSRSVRVCMDFVEKTGLSTGMRYSRLGLWYNLEFFTLELFLTTLFWFWLFVLNVSELCLGVLCYQIGFNSFWVANRLLRKCTGLNTLMKDMSLLGGVACLGYVRVDDWLHTFVECTCLVCRDATRKTYDFVISSWSWEDWRWRYFCFIDTFYSSAGNHVPVGRGLFVGWVLPD